MSTFIASFPDLSSARQVLRSLLGDGISSDDISLVARLESGKASNGRIEGGMGRTPDASSIVGRADDPAMDPTTVSDIHATHSGYLSDSSIGGGTSTATRDDSVSSVDEMDDSQSAEEELFSAPEDLEQWPAERRDLQPAIDEGIPPPLPSYPGDGLPPDHEADDSLDSIEIPGFGLVMGGGALATVALDFAAASPTESRNHFRSFLENEGVPGTLAESMLLTVEEGGAVLAVEVVPGETDPNAIEILATRTGATEAALFDAPRF